ncbi:MAG: hypothetical protein AWU57_809 [Marinobacter sp. T13-3]|nr:MAG: hypothetical protein AWU57_809 [Marinobacter sp. T13-3]
MAVNKNHETYEKPLGLPSLVGASDAQINFANNRRIAAIRRLMREENKRRSLSINDCAQIQKILEHRMPQIYSVTQAADWLDIQELRGAGLYEYFDNCQTFQEFMDEIKPPEIPPNIRELINL